MRKCWHPLRGIGRWVGDGPASLNLHVPVGIADVLPRCRWTTDRAFACVVPKGRWKVSRAPWWSRSPSKILENHISNKGFVSGLHKRLSQLNNKKTDNEDLSRHFTKVLQMADSTWKDASHQQPLRKQKSNPGQGREARHHGSDTMWFQDMKPPEQANPQTQKADLWVPAAGVGEWLLMGTGVFFRVMKCFKIRL